ncbi:polysaccharide deacetylase family protein [Salinisphaera sp. T31B1]|uniref:polysaccharide deacetylase family protein n=1 Tax=Salinisphaera sp. T31B1 TaxID=727963 RepID=UPI00333F34F0
MAGDHLPRDAHAPRLRVLMYHQVGPFARPEQQLGLYCHIDRFARQMAYLARHDIRVISLSEACRGLFGQARLPARAVVLSFDDGFQNFHDHAWPVLEAHGYPAVVYAVAARLGGHADWMKPEAPGDQRLMDGATLRTLADAGIEIGSHTLNHCRLGLEPEAVRHREIRDSRARLEDVLGRAVEHFAYPYGHYDAGVRELVAQAGYTSAVTCVRERADRAHDPFQIPRQGISYKDGRLRFAWKMQAAYRRPQD